MSSKTQKEHPKFSWDHDVPQTPFWTDLPFTTARNFLKCYSADELNAMTFPDDLARDDKLKLLLVRLRDKQAAKEAHYAPQPWHEAGYEEWVGVTLGMYTMHRELKELDTAIALLAKMKSHGTYNTQMSSKNMLADIYAETGRYAEAEAMGRDCLTWLRDMPVLGPQSPQALGCERRLMAALWKQGKYKEAKDMETDLRGQVEGLPGTQFEKYVEDEKQMLDDLVKELGAWKAAKESGSFDV